MCKVCQEKIARGLATKISNCPEKTGLPMNGVCLDCGMPVYAHLLKDGKTLRYKSREGQPHVYSCAAMPKFWPGSSGKWDYGKNKGNRTQGRGLDE